MGPAPDTGGGGENAPGGRNYMAPKYVTPPPGPVEEPPAQESERQEWGDLPPYLQSLQRRGTGVVIPPAYRRLFEAYLKRAGNKRR